MNKLIDKIVFITGANCPNGKASAIEAVREGGKVFLADIESVSMLEFEEELLALGGQCDLIDIDVCNVDSVKNAIQTVIDKYERIDVAFNISSHGGVYSNMHKMPEKVWDKVVVNNLTGQFYCVKYELQQFLKQGGGVIVNMSSLVDIETSKGLIPYTVSLHGVLGITKNIAFQYASDNIRANAICPSYAENISIGPVNRDFNKSLFEGTPTSKACSTKDIAKAFIYLASDDSIDCNGTQIIIDEDSE
jgi:NAD(P)-dependent dehydrogenase (short-subunit alcohol dehydrogenase family)